MNKLTQLQIDAMEAMLANDEASTDEELTAHLVSEVGVAIELADFAIIHRDAFLNMDPANPPSLRDLWNSGGIADEARAERCLSPGYGS
jgi:hypothetical protein